jgi:subtilisin family serine protease
LHAWTQINNGHRFSVTDPLSAAASPSINVTDENTIGGARTLPFIITVASYDHAKGTIAHDSSRGPVVDFSGSGPIATKPDIAAPGQEITSAQSSTGDFPPEAIKYMLGTFYVTMGGTSMATPHITGVVALMLGKNKSLTTADIFSKLKARSASPVNDFGRGKVDANQSFNAA